MTKVTGWDNGLCQDYDKGLGRWLANRLGARQQLRQDFKMTQFITIDRATLEQIVVALNEVDQHVDLKRYDTAPNEVLFDVVMAALAAGRAALANAEPKKISLTNTATGSLPQRIESIFEAMDKEVAAGRLVRTGPLEWSKPE